MADDKPVKLSPERWAVLAAHVGAERFGLATGDLEQVKVDVPIEIGGILFLPAVYRAA